MLAASAASAAAAYCAYTWYYASSPADAEPPPPDHASSSGSRPPADTSSEVEPSPSVLLEPSGGGPGTAQMDAEAHLQHHFRSIQAIAEGTTLPSLLPTLSRAVAAADDLDAALERLRLAKEGAIQLDPEEKQTLWRELSIDALARLVAALWMLPLLCLQVRVQLNILGRHLYLESALADPGTALPGPSRPPRQLTPASQEAFLSHAEYLAKSGHVLLLKNARHAAQQALQSMSLTAALDAAGLQQLLSEALAEFVRDSSAVDGRWAAYLLPPPQELRESLLLRRPDNRAMLPGAERTWVDAEAVEGMVGEVGSILASERFHDVAMVSGYRRIRGFCLPIQRNWRKMYQSRSLPLLGIMLVC